MKTKQISARLDVIAGKLSALASEVNTLMITVEVTAPFGENKAKQRRHTWTADERKEIVNLAEKGLSAIRIAATMGVGFRDTMVTAQLRTHYNHFYDWQTTSNS